MSKWDICCMNGNKRTLLILIILAIALPLTYFVATQNQDNRNRAAESRDLNIPSKIAEPTQNPSNYKLPKPSAKPIRKTTPVSKPKANVK